MQRDPRAFLWDVRESVLAIQAFTAEMDAAAFAANEMAQSAVERKFEIIGEALNQLAKLDAALAARVAENRGISQSAHSWLCHRERQHSLECDAERVAAIARCRAGSYG